jgi:hypothetical protein
VKGMPAFAIQIIAIGDILGRVRESEDNHSYLFGGKLFTRNL